MKNSLLFKSLKLRLNKRMYTFGKQAMVLTIKFFSSQYVRSSIKILKFNQNLFFFLKDWRDKF